jgi:hypothetical protein
MAHNEAFIAELERESHPTRKMLDQYPKSPADF